MLSPRNNIDYNNPAGFNCGSTQQRNEFITYHQITQAEFESCVNWFNGLNAVPSGYTVSATDIENLIDGADCNTDALIILGQINTLGHTDMSIALATYADISNNPPTDFLGAYGIELFNGLIKSMNADEFSFYKGTYTYTTNPIIKLQGAIFIAYSDGEPVYYAEYAAK